MYTLKQRTDTMLKYLARLNQLCNYVSATVTVLRSTEVPKDVDAVIRNNAKLISELQEIQRVLIFIKNSSSETPQFPKPRPPAGTACAFVLFWYVH